MGNSWKHLRILTICAWTSFGMAVSEATSDETYRAGWLASHDLVGEGVLVSVEDLFLRPQKSCWRGYADSLIGVLATIKVSRLQVGTLPDSFVKVARGDSQPFGRQGEWIGQPGDRVFFRAMRYCEYAWQPIGDVLLISPGDTLMSGDRPSAAMFPLIGAPLDEIRMQLESMRENQGLTPFDGAQDVVLVRLDEYLEGDTGNTLVRDFSYKCTGLARLYGSDTGYPSSLKFILESGCAPFFGPGDTLVVPVPAELDGEEWFVEACPRQWKVEEGYIPGFGVALADLKRKLSLVAGSTRLQRIGLADSSD